MGGILKTINYVYNQSPTTCYHLLKQNIKYRTKYQIQGTKCNISQFQACVFGKRLKQGYQTCKNEVNSGLIFKLSICLDSDIEHKSFKNRDRCFV